MMDFNPVFEDPPGENSKFPASIAPVIFQSSGKKLIGTFFLASGEGPHPTVLLLHGFPGNELNYDIAHSIRRSGINVMVFHYRGSWGSDGDFTFKNGLEDVASALDFLNSEFAENNFRVNSDNIVLIGHSFGGFAALLNAVNHPEIKNIASLAGFNFGYFTQFTENDPEVKEITIDSLKTGSLMLNQADPYSLYNEMVQHQNEWNLLNLNNNLIEKNILLVGAESDTVSPKEIHHTPLVKSLSNNNNKIEERVISSGHSFSSKRIKLNEIVINWINRIEF